MDYSRIREAIDRDIYLGTTTGNYVCTINGNGFYTIRLQKSGLFIEADIFGKEIYTIRSTGNAGTFKLKVVNDKLFINSSGFAVYVYYTTDSVTNGTGSYTFVDGDTTYTVGEIYYLKPTNFSSSTNKIDAASVDVGTIAVNTLATTGTTTLNSEQNTTVGINNLFINNAILNATQIETIYADNITADSIKVGKWTITSGDINLSITIS